MFYRHKPLIKRCRGFSLIELICAIFIVSTGISGTLYLYLSGLDHIKFTEEKLVVMQALENELESLRALPFADLQIGKNQPFRSSTPAMKHLVKVRCSTTIQDSSEQIGAKNEARKGLLKTVVLSIRWRGDHGRRVEKTLSSRIANKD